MCWFLKYVHIFVWLFGHKCKEKRTHMIMYMHVGRTNEAFPQYPKRMNVEKHASVHNSAFKSAPQYPPGRISIPSSRQQLGSLTVGLFLEIDDILCLATRKVRCGIVWRKSGRVRQVSLNLIIVTDVLWRRKVWGNVENFRKIINY